MDRGRGREGGGERKGASIRVAPPLYSQREMAYTMRGNARLSLKDYTQAIDDFSEVVRLDPKNSMAYRNRGIAYCKTGETDRAIAACTEAIRLDPKDALAYIASRWCLRGEV